jgi:hypothetical protein
MEWHALNIAKYHNVYYRCTIATQGILRQLFKQCLQFEINCLKLCLLDEET